MTKNELRRRNFNMLVGTGALLSVLPGGCSKSNHSQAVINGSSENHFEVPESANIPDFSQQQIQGYSVGIRPYREKELRLERESFGDKILIHNYGHGGAGVTLSWGCATEVLSLLGENNANSKSVAILGGGVLGLSCALLLSEAGFSVSIYAEKITPNTTSDRAGAQWSPSFVAVGESTSRQALLERVLRSSYSKFQALKGDEYGVYDRLNYVEDDHDNSFYKIPKGVLPPFRLLDSLPFPGISVGGRVFKTLLIEPPTYMPRLLKECLDQGAQLEKQRLESIDQVKNLDAEIVVNCLGLGAGKLFDDKLVVPIKGELVHLKPQKLNWLLSHQNGYIFPRKDSVVLGGSAERGISIEENDAEVCQDILNRNRKFFETDNE